MLFTLSYSESKLAFAQITLESLNAAILSVVLLVMLYKVVLTFESVDETPKYDQGN